MAHAPVGTHPLAQHPLPGIGEGRQRRLIEAGFDTLEALVASDPGVVAALPYFGDEVAQAAIAAARAKLSKVAAKPAAKPAPASKPAPAAKPSPEDEALGAMLDVQQPAGRPAQAQAPAPSGVSPESVDRAREKVDEARRLAEDSVGEGGRRKVRRELRRVGRTLKALRRRMVEGALPAALQPVVQTELERLDGALGRLLSGEALPKRFRKARKEAKQAREALDQTATVSDAQ